jgi:ribosomal protein S18 acetylase RimI-like enzyme
MDNVTIQPCTMTGFSEVLPILDTQTEAFDYATKRYIIQQAAKALDQNPQHPLVFVAHHETAIIGFIGFILDADNPTLAELFGQVVKRGFQGQGVGSQLLQIGLDHLKQVGTSEVRLSLKASTPPYVSHFYKKAGFKPAFNETYTGASDESHTLVLLFNPPATEPPSFYPA